jgi:aryl-alcohol dehydrogenase-like predicted oxidoreductase
LSVARLNQIDCIDTAIAYGDSEICLGKVGVDEFNVITKLPDVPKNVTDIGSWVRDEVSASLLRLKLKSVYSVLVHHSQQLLAVDGKELFKTLVQMKGEGIMEKIGISIYAPSELDSLADVYKFDIVQAPFNHIDQRLKSSGWMQKLHDQGVEIHTRSTFLQGLLLMPLNEVPEKFNKWSQLFHNWHKWLFSNNISAAQACICFVQMHPQIDKFLVGIEDVHQFKHLIQVAKAPRNILFPDIICSDEYLVNPSFWRFL